MKNLAKISGVKTLNKHEQKNINGSGHGHSGHPKDGPCRSPLVNCYVPTRGWRCLPDSTCRNAMGEA